MKTITHAVALSAPVAATPGLPTEARLFKAGANETTKGTYVFDAQSARAVMTAYRAQGTDVMIDLEHEALGASAPRPDSRDARGWGKLELRGGDLWLTQIKWTADGAARLERKSQRYFSPAFLSNEGHVVEIVNVALVSMPATLGAPALVAASRAAVLVRPVELSARTQALLGRTTSTVIHARVPNAVANEIRTLAATLRTTPGHLLRALATAAGASKKDRAKLAELLGLPKDAPDEAVRAAVDQMLTDTADAPSTVDPAASAAATPPPTTLTRAERAGIKRLGITADDYIARKSRAATRI